MNKAFKTGILLAAALCLQPLAGAVELRGYGDVTAELGKDGAVFHCQDTARADILLGKLSADLLWDAKAKKLDLDIGGKAIPALEIPPHGVMVLGASGSDVLTFGAADAASMRTLLAAKLKGDLRFQPAKPYPLYLDYYDLRAFKFYVHAAKSAYGEGIASHWAFVKKLGLGGMAAQSLGVVGNNPAPGVVDFSQMDFEVMEAERQNGLFVPCPDVGGELPLWMYNKNPDNSAKFSPSYLYQGWSTGSIGTTYECDGGDGASPLASLRLMMGRYLKSPSLGGWHLYRGQPIGDNVSVICDGCSWDHSPVAQVAFRKWLKDSKGLDLAALGERWFNDPKHFSSWDDVKVPDLAALVGGGYDPDKLLLPSSWQWRKAAPEDYGKAPAANGAAWIPVLGPPSQQMAFLPSGSAYYKTTVNASAWLKAHAGRQVRLGCTVGIYDHNKLNFWLNGHAFASQPLYSSGYVPSVTDIPAGVLNLTGDNELIVQTPDGRSDGRLGGTVFLSDKPRQLFPYQDKALNRRYSDALDFQRDSIFVRQQEMFDEARRLDPDRPIILSGVMWEDIGKFAALAAKQGLALQYTAREGFYNPWNPALGNLLGFYATSEPSGVMGTPDVFNKTLGVMFYDGDSSFDAFWDVEDYIRLDRQYGMLSKQRRLLQLFGKYLREKPRLLLFRSALSIRCHSNEPWNWDVGRGEIQSAHYDYGYVSERQIQDGTVNAYPVLFDAGSDIMDEETVAALRRYVEAGGTFVALHCTGRSDPLAANTWPISKLTGFQVTDAGKQGNIRFAEQLPVFKGWEGKQFKAKGIALDWKKNDVADGSGVVLRPEQPGTRGLAFWEDGSIAVGLREFGKGKVIVLGASFWRDGQDVNGRWVPQGVNAFFDRLLPDLGVNKDADASSNKIWVRKVTTKNGLQDWLVAANANERDNAPVTSDLSFKVDSVPDTVIDMLSYKPVAFKTRPGGWIDIPAVKFDKYATRVFAVKRADTVADALPVWWGEKLKYWRKPAAKPVAPIPAVAAAPEAIQFDQWSFKTDSGDWIPLPSGSWNLLDPKLKDYRGVGLYRKDFTIPAEWKGHVVTLNLLDHAACGKGVFSVNGTKVYEFVDGSFHRELAPLLNFDITKLLDFDGKNTLSVRVEPGKELSGICGAVWIAPERVLSPSLDLKGTWTCVQKDYATAKDALIPGKTFGRYLKREVDIPADWAGRQIFLHMESGRNWCGCVMVNGVPKTQTASLSPFGTRLDLNLTPFLKPGQRNLIELWPTHGIPGNWRATWYWPNEAPMDIQAISLGCEVKP